MTGRHARRRVVATGVALIAALLGACSSSKPSSPAQQAQSLVGPKVVSLSGSWKPQPAQRKGLTAVASVADGKLLLHTAGGDRSFLPGVNLGGALPGHAPGEINSITAEDYRRWIQFAGDVGVRVIRNYTIHPPAFYDALAAYNRAHEDVPIYLVQGVYFVDEAAYADTADLWAPQVRDAFLSELNDASAAVSGKLQRPPTPGRASGQWTTDVSPWLAGWIIGIELDPIATSKSDQLNASRPLYTGKYFANTPDASPTERWLAEAMDRIATDEAAAGRTSPVAFANWPTDDPLRHPDEPLDREDLEQIDANHVLPTADWPGGSFASYHAYPYYPDFLRHEPALQVPYPDGTVDPYRRYVRALSDHHRLAGLPTVISEFGVPSALGSAHNGPLGRDQGDHSEAEAMSIDGDLLKMFKDEGLAGGFAFASFDEWFKFTWNTLDVQIPGDRRPLWHDALTNEQHFGLLAVDSSLEDKLRLGDPYTAWQPSTRVVYESRTGLRELRLATDESYVYLRFRFDKVPTSFTLGFDVVPGADSGGLPGRPGVGAQSDVAVEVTGSGTAGQVLGWAGADFTNVYYGAARRYFPVDPSSLANGSVQWVPKRMIVNRPLRVPSSGEALDAEFVDISKLVHATTIPGGKTFDQRSEIWSTKTDVAVRLPWALLGMSDPSSQQALQVKPDGTLSTVTIGQIGLTVAGSGLKTVETPIQWEAWQKVASTERPKDGLATFSAAVGATLAGK